MPTPSTPDRDAISAFLATIYGDAELNETASIAIWYTQPRAGDKPDRKFPTEWHTDVGEAADALASLPPSFSAYYGVCLHSRPQVDAAVEARNVGAAPQVLTKRKSFSRGFADTVTVVPGVWLDVDFGTEGHDQGNLPPDEESAMSIINEMPLEPSLLIRTGGGFHAYWLFEEPWEINTDQDRADAKAAVYGWNLLAIDTAERLGGWTVDSTADLARVLRPAGTLNPKHPGRLVASRAISDRRFNPDDFEIYAQTPQTRAQSRPVPEGALAPGSSAPAQLLELMLELDAGFKQTWERRRGGQFGDDASRYEQALASRVLAAGWSDADTLALLIQFRREQFAEGPKHDLYYSNTLATARGDAQTADAFDRVDEMVQALEEGFGGTEVPDEDEPEDDLGMIPELSPRAASTHTQASPNPLHEQPAPPPTNTPPDSVTPPGDHLELVAETDLINSVVPDFIAPDVSAVKKREILANVSEALRGSFPGHMVITGLIEYPAGTFAADAQYSVILNGAEVRLGTITCLLTYRIFRETILGATHVLTTAMKQIKWERLLRGMMKSITVRVDSHKGEEIQGVVVEMLSQTRIVWHDGVGRPSRQVSYYTTTGQIGLSLPQLRQWLQATGDRYSAQALSLELRAAGSEPKKVWFHHLDENGIRTRSQTRLWSAPWADAMIPTPQRPDEISPGSGELTEGQGDE